MVQHRLASAATHHAVRVLALPVGVPHPDAADIGWGGSAYINKLRVGVGLGSTRHGVVHVFGPVLPKDIRTFRADGEIEGPYLLLIPLLEIQTPHVALLIWIPLPAHPRDPWPYRGVL